MVLLVMTAATRAMPAGWWITPISLGIAALKAFLVAYLFMRLREEKALVRIFAGAGLFWLLILLVLTGADYLTRSWYV
jgi:cytochrome c oxidase subunit 4